MKIPVGFLGGLLREPKVSMSLSGWREKFLLNTEFREIGRCEDSFSKLRSVVHQKQLRDTIILRLAHTDR